MLGFNWIDLIILLSLVGAAWLGWRNGFITQLLVIGAFFSTLFLTGWLFPRLLPIHDRTLQTLIVGNLVLLTAVYAAVRGYDLGRHVNHSLKTRTRLYSLERHSFGPLLSMTALLIIIWLFAAGIGRLPFAGLSNSANDAWIVQQLDTHLPPIPAVFARFDGTVDPNSPPRIFEKINSQVNLVSTPALTGQLQAVASQADASTVRVTSFGCGGLVSGSGFVAAPDLVMTNAHVVAGVRKPVIKTTTGSFRAVPVVFDPNLDLAVLRVPGLNLRPLQLASSDVSDGTQLAVLGYPKGNYAAVPGVVRNDMAIFDRNIYDVGVFGRQVYEVQTRVDDGSSGSPLILANGQVAGVIFAKSNTLDDYAYALTSSRLMGRLHQAEASSQRVSTGVCLAN